MDILLAIIVESTRYFFYELWPWWTAWIVLVVITGTVMRQRSRDPRHETLDNTITVEALLYASHAAKRSKDSRRETITDEDYPPIK